MSGVLINLIVQIVAGALGGQCSRRGVEGHEPRHGGLAGAVVTAVVGLIKNKMA
jgi:hypothetical protein